MIPKRFTVQEYDKEHSVWFDVRWAATFADAMLALDALSRRDSNAGKWYIVRPVTDKAVA